MWPFLKHLISLCAPGDVSSRFRKSHDFSEVHGGVPFTIAVFLIRVLTGVTDHHTEPVAISQPAQLPSWTTCPPLSAISLSFIFSLLFSCSFIWVFTDSSPLWDKSCVKAGTLSVWPITAFQVQRTVTGTGHVPKY